jgi:hypothetical protein
MAYGSALEKLDRENRISDVALAQIFQRALHSQIVKYHRPYVYSNVTYRSYPNYPRPPATYSHPNAQTYYPPVLAHNLQLQVIIVLNVLHERIGRKGNAFAIVGLSASEN